MKKVVRITKKILLILCAVLILAVIFVLYRGGRWHLEIEDAAAIAEIYYEDETLFEAAVETLLSYSEKEIYVTASADVKIAPSFKCYQVGELYLYVLDSILTEEECQKISEAAIPLFEKRGLVYISSYRTEVRFALERGYGQFADLYYEANGGEILTPFGVVDELQFNKYWYAVTSSD